MNTEQQRLHLQALNQQLSQPWIVQSGKLYKMFSFTDFNSAFGFMTRVAYAAEQLNHHPDWCNHYNRVDIHLITHEKQQLTLLDFTLAEKIEQCYLHA